MFLLSANEILEKNALETGDRPRSIVCNEVLSRGMRILFVHRNDQHRRMRKAMHSQLSLARAKTIEPVQYKAALAVVGDIMEDPTNFQDHINTYAATIVFYMAYGRQDKVSYRDPDVQKIIEVQNRIGLNARPGLWLVESFPILRYVPGYLKEPERWHREELKFFRDALFATRQKMITNEAAPCFASWMTDSQKELDLNDSEVAYLCGSVFGAGSDTSSSAIAVTVMAAATHPEQQLRVQQELDAVVGKNRVPQFDDWNDLPVTQAFCRETYRWRPVSAGGFAHRTTSDLNFNGHLIPNGTTIMGNHWAINR